MRVQITGYQSDTGLGSLGIYGPGMYNLTLEERQVVDAQVAANQAKILSDQDAEQASMIRAGDFSWAREGWGPGYDLQRRLDLARTYAINAQPDHPLSTIAIKDFIAKAEAEIAGRPEAIAAKTSADAAQASADKLAAETALKQTQETKAAMQVKIDEALKSFSALLTPKTPEPIRQDIQNLVTVKQDDLRTQLVAAGSLSAMDRILADAKSSASRYQAMADDLENGRTGSAKSIINNEIARVEPFPTQTIVIAAGVGAAALIGLYFFLR